jgi:hypothetical protein
MDAIRRLREHVAESPDSSGEHEIRSSSPGASSSTSKTDDHDHEMWYRHLPRGKGKGKAIKSPYEFFHVSIVGLLICRLRPLEAELSVRMVNMKLPAVRMSLTLCVWSSGRSPRLKMRTYRKENGTTWRE